MVFLDVKDKTDMLLLMRFFETKNMESTPGLGVPVRIYYYTLFENRLENSF